MTQSTLCPKCKIRQIRSPNLGKCLECWVDGQLEKNHIIYDRLAEI